MSYLLGALLSSDSVLAEACAPSLHLARPLGEISEGDLDQLGQREFDWILVDLDGNVAMGLELVRFLAESEKPWVILAAGTGEEHVLAAMQAGALEYLPKPMSRDEWKEAEARLQRKSRRAASSSEQRSSSQVLTLVSAKGGSGTSTIATNLAVEFARKGERTLLWELDAPLGAASVLLRLGSRRETGHFLSHLHRMDENLLGSFVEKHSSGLHVIGAPEALAGAVGEADAERVREGLSFLLERYSRVVIDASAPWRAAVQSALMRSDRRLWVSTPEILGLRNIQRLLPSLQEYMGEGSEILLNRYPEKGGMPIAEVEKVLGLPVIGTVREDAAGVQRAAADGEPLVQSAQVSAAGADIRELAERLLGQETKSKAKSRTPRFGWLRRS